VHSKYSLNRENWIGCSLCSCLLKQLVEERIKKKIEGVRGRGKDVGSYLMTWKRKGAGT
jgi:hypothetical protein